MNSDKSYYGKDVLKEALVILGLVVDIAHTVYDGLSLFGIESKKRRPTPPSRRNQYSNNYNPCDYDDEEYDEYNRALTLYDKCAESVSRNRSQHDQTYIRRVQ